MWSSSFHHMTTLIAESISYRATNSFIVVNHDHQRVVPGDTAEPHRHSLGGVHGFADAVHCTGPQQGSGFGRVSLPYCELDVLTIGHSPYLQAKAWDVCHKCATWFLSPQRCSHSVPQ